MTLTELHQTVKRLYFHLRLAADAIAERLNVTLDLVCAILSEERHKRRKMSARYRQRYPKPVKPHGLVKAYCKHGHPMVDWNLYIYPDGDRECRACRKLHQPLSKPKHLAEWGYEG